MALDGVHCSACGVAGHAGFASQIVRYVSPTAIRKVETRGEYPNELSIANSTFADRWIRRFRS